MIVAVPRRARKRAPKPRPTKALTLDAAAYQPGAWVRLTFDRPAVIGGVDPAAVTVDDAVIGTLFRGAGVATLVSPRTVQVDLVEYETSSGGPGRRLTAGPSTGVVAADDGGTWAGVAGLSLPFP